MSALLAAAINALPASASTALAENTYAEQLVQKAHELRLADTPRWQALGHYEQSLFLPGVESRADDPKFFLSPEGKYSPQAELDATIRSMFREPTAEERNPRPQESETKIVFTDDLVQHPQCAFPARLHWLKQQLAIAPSELPQITCVRFEEWKRAVDPVRITLVFPAAFLNNPASMFGHTLLRLDTRGLDDNSQLLSYAANYAASTQGDLGLVYAAKGLFGGYEGHFSILPYYDRVKKYNDLERRDIWEYELNLTDDEIAIVVEHLWELRSIYFNYFYFDENCAFHLLAVLEVARPELKLTPQFPFWAIPGDTVRAVLANHGLLKRTVFRPAMVTILEAHLSKLTPAEFAMVQQLGRGTLATDDPSVLNIPEDRRALIYDAAFEYLQFLLIARKIEPETVSKTNFQLLKARSALNVPPDEQPIPVPKIRPDQGHESSRIGLGAGVRDSLAYSQFTWRASFHDLLDPAPGYVDGAQIELFDADFRYYEEDGAKLERFTFVDVLSLSPSGRLSSPWAWHIRPEIVRTRIEDGEDQLVGRLTGGFGLNYSPSARLRVFALVAPDLRYSGEYRDDISLGIGPTINVLSRIDDRTNVLANAGFSRFAVGDATDAWNAALSGQRMLTPQTGIRVTAERAAIFADAFSQFGATFFWYF